MLYTVALSGSLGDIQDVDSPRFSAFLLTDKAGLSDMNALASYGSTGSWCG